MGFSFSPKLGIDLGTTYTLVYVPGRGVVLREPSVVAVSEQENKILAVGDEAKEMIGRTPDDIVAYRPMKDGVIADYRVTEAMLRYYMRKATGWWSFFRPDVMISVPAGVTSAERRAVIEAAVKAGAKTAQVVKEPILAAIGAGIPIHEAQGHMIVDIGGGTTDVAVISLGGIVASTSVKCAGNRIDEAITAHIKKTFNLAIGDKTAEDIKIHIGSAIPLEEELTMVVKGRDYLTGLPRSVDLSTNEVVKAIGRELREIVKAIRDVLQETPPELAADIIDNGIIMSGGSSQLRNLPELVYRRTGVKATLADDALYSVAKGTGIALQHWDIYKKQLSRNGKHEFLYNIRMDSQKNLDVHNLHHAYILPDTDAEFLSLKKILRDTYASAEEYIREFGVFGIDDSRELIRLASMRSLGKQLFLYRMQSCTREAQNALLKLFEEPPEHTHFFLCIGDGSQNILPTLKSRVWILEGTLSHDVSELGQKFLAASGGERLKLIETIIKDKDMVTAQGLLRELEHTLYERKAYIQDASALRHIINVRNILSDKGASLKILLESVALVTPKLS